MDELDFKSNINLSEYAAAQSYEIDRRASSKSSMLMRQASGDKIMIARGTDQHWIYFLVRDDRDNGTIIDFVQKRKGVGYARSSGLGSEAPGPSPGHPRTCSHKQSSLSPKTGRGSAGAGAHEALAHPCLPRRG